MKPTASDHLADADLARLGLSRDAGLVLDPLGRFLVRGVPVAHPDVAAAFARWLDRHEPPGEPARYVVRNDLCYAYVDVQGAPLHADRVEVEGEGAAQRARLRLQGGERVPFDPRTLREGPDGALYASARDGTWAVRLRPAAALDLAPYVEEGPEGPVLALGGERHPVRRVADPLAGVQGR